MLERRTKIVATLGPATDAPGVLDRLVAAGMDCARLNCSHGDADALKRRAAEVRAAAERCGRPLGLLFDLQGPKLRLSKDTAEQVMQPDDTITFAENSPGPGRVLVDFEGFSRLVTERSQIVIGDGVPRFAVEDIRPGEVDCRTISPGRLAPRKGINVTHARPELPAITEKDAEDLETAVALGADFVALSFVRSAQDIEELAQRLRDLAREARTIAKIEKVEAYEQLDEIIGVANGVMVARGDYGVEAGVARRAADAEGHDLPGHAGRQARHHRHADARVDDPGAGADARRGHRRRQRGDRRHVRRSCSRPRRASAATRSRRSRPWREIAEAAEASPVIHGRGLNVEPESAAGCRHARRGEPRAARSTPVRSSSRPRPAARRARSRSTASGGRSSRPPTSRAWPTSSRSSGASQPDHDRGRRGRWTT